MSKNEQTNEQYFCIAQARQSVRGEAKMLINERYKLIAEYLKEKGSAKVGELAERLFVSPATIRRDLAEMNKLGLVERSHGGAIFAENANEVSIFIRVEKDAKEKERAASIALSCLPEFNTVFIDNSSTCLALAERMNFAHKTVVTNGIQIATRLSQKKDVKVFMPGGEVTFNSGSVSGSATCEALRSMRLDLMLSSCAAVCGGGAYENSAESAMVKRTAFGASRYAVLVVGKSKFFAEATYLTMPLSAYGAVATDLDDDAAEKLRESGVNIVNTKL